MTDAPERIWMDGDIEVGEGYWTRCFEDRKPCNEPALEYLRADYAFALVAEAYEVAAVIASDNAPATVKATAIRAMTPSDALAAREARDKRMRDEALREAVEHIKGMTLIVPPNGIGAREVAESVRGQCARILALIERDQTDG